MKKSLTIMLSLLVLLPATTTTAQFFSKKKGNRKHQALVTYTDGKTAEGALWLGVGEELRFSTSSEDYTYGEIRRLKLHELKSFAWVARSETLEQRWRWKEVVLPNGRKDKQQEFFGEPYPLRDLGFSYTAIDNQQHQGSLDTLVFYFRPDATPEKTEKHVIYRGKNRRDPGTSWEAFVQVQSVHLLDQQDKNLPPYKTLHFHNMQLTKDDAVTFMSYTHLNQRQAEWDEEKGTFVVRNLLNEDAYICVRHKEAYYIGWQNQVQKPVAELAQKGLDDFYDFYFDKRYLGGRQNPNEREVDVFALYQRLPLPGKFGVKANVNRYWKLVVVRMHYGLKEQQVNFMKLGSFERIRWVEQDKPANLISSLPKVYLSEDLWHVEDQPDRMTFGVKGARPAHRIHPRTILHKKYSIDPEAPAEEGTKR